jgi:hypothetical protein
VVINIKGMCRVPAASNRSKRNNKVTSSESTLNVLFMGIALTFRCRTNLQQGIAKMLQPFRFCIFVYGPLLREGIYYKIYCEKF